MSNSNKIKSIPIKEFFKAAEEQGNIFIALSSQNQVKKGKNHKAPARTWDENPKDYQGLSDPKYGTGIRCTYIEKLNKHFVVIDLDVPKKENDISIDKLQHILKPWIEGTYSVRTPSGGIHIYFLSEEQPTAAQPKINIDYQSTTGENKGKYIVGNYRWDKKGDKKELYEKIPESPESIVLVPNTDKGLNNIMEILTEEGLILTPKKEHQNKTIEIFKKYVEEGSRDNYSLAIIGYLRKLGYKPDAVKEIIKEVFNPQNDDDPEKRLRNVDQTYNKPAENTVGYSYLKEHLSKKDLERLTELIKTSNGDLKLKILQHLSKNKEPSSKLLADHINENLELYKNLDTNKYYERVESGQFQEIDERRIINYCNDNFGYNNISSKRCYEVLKHITRPIRKNYDLIEFNNGIVNTKTKEFKEDKTLIDETPKLTLNLNWNSEATPGEIGEIIDKILDHPEYTEDKQRWIRAVGHAFMGDNRIGKLTMVQGPSGTGKSTLTAILQRIFNYSNLPTSTINANERFTLHPMIDKDINIDDDINNGMLKAIGTLNTIITGNALEVEIKGENRSIKAESEQIPRLFANGNTLPPVFGEGFQRRLLLIHANNQIDYEERDEMLQQDIKHGKYDDKGLEWFIYNAINTYWDKIDKPITSKETEARMKADYEFKSYPLKKGIEAIFEYDFTGLDKLQVREVNFYCKAWSIWAFKNGKISKEHRKPSQKQIRRAMDNAGYDQSRDRDEGRIYEDIRIKPEWEKILRDLYRKQQHL